MPERNMAQEKEIVKEIRLIRIPSKFKKCVTRKNPRNSLFENSRPPRWHYAFELALERKIAPFRKEVIIELITVTTGIIQQLPFLSFNSA